MAKPAALERAYSHGFTLLEVLLSLWLVGACLLGIAGYLGRGLNPVISNEVNSSVSLIQSQIVESIEQRLAENVAEFQAGLNQYKVPAKAPIAYGNSMMGEFTVQISGHDFSNAKNLLLDAPGGWTPPLIVKIDIVYRGARDQLTFKTTHVFVP